MEFAVLNDDLKELRRRNRGLSLALTLVAAALLASLVAILNILGAERTVVVPPNLTKTFWITSGKASPEYLEQMAAFVAGLILDVSPATIDWKRDTLLTYVAPQHYGELKTRQDIEAERLRRTNATTYFLPQQLLADEHNQSVVVLGRLRTQVNGSDTSTENKAYLVQFDYALGRVHLQTFKEVPYDRQSAPSVADDSAARR